MTRFDGIELPNIVQRRFDVRMTESKTKLDVLTTRLAKARHLKAFEHLTIYAAGSYGRLEASKYSDIDLFFVLAKPRSYFDEIRVPEIRLLSEIVEIGYDMDFPKFSNDGHFLKLLFLDDILENLGSPADDYHNHFTARMLLLLESKPIYGVNIYNRLLRETTNSYLPRHEQKKLEHDRILEELLLLARQQSRVLSNPAGLIGEEILALLLRLTHEPEGAAIRLVHKERDLVLALCGRWGRLQYELNGYISVLDPKERPRAREMIERFSSYVKELQSILVGTATTQSIQQAFGSSSQTSS
ncbi:nucleotidyltransferase domain-containing protein [Bradyrhizobium sp. BRP19]|uniref:nucleotidyltransferase domain-containing protein n=1 Tax=Bradyrhizobium sp. BRP19 TaxID=2793823 RepID=UPI001CD6C347|nr:nucleotidyltransferase domain-containing protein [Bradyrhizobium sp. BRP19]MCA1546646.1 nucleotidyltransferase domain-containing protein [Bradyrhizobium sp. BRP19]